VNAEETGRLLAKCASYDRRKIGEAEVIAWLQAIGDLNYRDCETAVVGHYTDSTDWIMPAHVRQRVRKIRDERIDRAKIPAPPPEIANGDRETYRAVLHAARVAVADGRDPEAAMRVVTGTPRREIEAP
jgi:hypothetical protein